MPSKWHGQKRSINASSGMLWDTADLLRTVQEVDFRRWAQILCTHLPVRRFDVSIPYHIATAILEAAQFVSNNVAASRLPT